MTKLNADQIAIIYIHTKTRCSHYEYRKQKRFLFWTDIEGFYFVYCISPYHVPKELISTVNKNLYYEGEVVYYKQHVEMKMSNGQVVVKYFESVDELEVFLDQPEIKKLTLIPV